MDNAITIAQLIAGIISAIVAIVACVLSYKSYKSQEDLAQRQLSLAERAENRDELRYKQRIDAEATAFLQRNQAERLFIPLCEVAYKYNKSRAYRRDIYRDYCGLPKDVRSQILNREELKIRLPDAEGEELFNLALDRVQSMIPGLDGGVFYDNGKYFKRAIERYGDKPLYSETRQYEKGYGPTISRLISNKDHQLPYSDQMSDVLSSEDVDISDAIDFLKKEYSFGTICEHEACQFATELAWQLVFFKSEKTESDNCGCPEDFLYGEQIYMEDLFLYALYEICLNADWTNH